MAFQENDQQLAIALVAFSEEFGPRVCELLKPEMFSSAYRQLYKAVYRHTRRKRSAIGEAHFFDLVQDAVRATPGDTALIASAANDIYAIGSGFDPKYAMSRVEKFLRWTHFRNLAQGMLNLMQTDTDESLEELEHLLSTAKLEVASSNQRELLDLSDAAQVREAYDSAENQPLPFGIDPLTAELAVPHRGQLFAIAGSQGMGKTQMLFDASLSMARINMVNGLYFSLEMDKSEMARRGIMNMTGRTLTGTGVYTEFVYDANNRGRVVGLNRQVVDAGALDGYKDSELEGFFDEGVRVLVDDRPRITPTQIRARIQELKDQGIYLGFIAVDYWQIMGIDDQNRKYECQEDNLEQLYEIAREENLAVLIGSQFNRDNSDGNDPSRKNIKGSISLFDHCHVVLFMAQTKFEKAAGLIRIIKDKNRNFDGGASEFLVATGYSNSVFATDAVVLDSSVKSVIEEEMSEDEEDDDDFQ